MEHDERLHGLIKWYVTPLVFGGDPNLGETVIWVNIETHFELVTFWNDKYDEAATTGDQNRRLTSHCSRRRAVCSLGAEAPLSTEMHGITPLADAARRLDVSGGKRRAALPLRSRGLAAAE